MSLGSGAHARAVTTPAGEGRQVLDAAVVDAGLGARLAERPGEEGALAPGAFHKVDLVRAHDGQDQAGQPGAAAQVHHGTTVIWEQGMELGRIENMTAPGIMQAGPAH